jgi:hypothetical protein
MTTKTTTKKTKEIKEVPTTNTKKFEVISDNLPTNPFAFEVLQLVSKQRTNAKKVEILKKYEDASLKSIFIWNFDESIISMLPEGEVPYASVGEQNSFSGTVSEKITDAVSKMQEIGTNSLGANDQGRSSIRKEYNAFYNFIRGGNDSLSSLRRETMFINVLQGLHPLEAEIVCLCKDKKLQTKYKITKEIVSQAYPDIRWGGRG